MTWLYYRDFQWLLNVSQISRVHIDATDDGHEYLMIETLRRNESIWISHDECDDLDELLGEIMAWVSNPKEYSDNNPELCKGSVLILDHVFDKIYFKKQGDSA